MQKGELLLSKIRAVPLRYNNVGCSVPWLGKNTGVGGMMMVLSHERLA